MKLTGAAILVSRGMKVLPAAPAAYPFRSAAERTEAQMRKRVRVILCSVGFLAIAAATTAAIFMVTRSGSAKDRFVGSWEGTGTPRVNTYNLKIGENPGPLSGALTLPGAV